MIDEDQKLLAPAKGPKKAERPEPAPVAASVLSFDEYVLRDALPAARISGLRLHLQATTGFAARPLAEWQAVMTHYQALA